MAWEPTAPGIAYRQYDDAAQQGQLARDAWQSFMPDIRVQQALNSDPLYAQAAQGVAGDVSGMASKLGYGGDISGMVGSAGNRFKLDAMKRNLGSQEQAFNANRATQLQRGLSNFQKGNTLMDMSRQLGRLPQQAQLAWAQEGDAVERMKRGAQAPLSPWAQVAGGVGGMAGDWLGNYVASQRRRPDPMRGYLDAFNQYDSIKNQFDLPAFA